MSSCRCGPASPNPTSHRTCIYVGRQHELTARAAHPAADAGLRVRTVRRGVEMNSPLHLGIVAGKAEHDVDDACTIDVEHIALHASASRQRRSVADDPFIHDLWHGEPPP